MSGQRKKLWGGRFRWATDPAVERFTRSLAVDRRLARQDLVGSIAHAKMLAKCRIIPSADGRKIVRGLTALLGRLEKGTLTLDASAEDVHSAVQAALERQIGPAALRLHAARSRNDQVVTDLRIYCKEKTFELQARVACLQKEVLRQAKKSGNLLMPAYTHLRHAQPVLTAHLLLSYLPALERDKARLAGAWDRADELPLGSGAIAGTGLPTDRAFLARELGFSRISDNSIDAVTSRDFAAEFLAALSILGVHLARIAEDLMLWSTPEFGFVRFSERMLTGSSMMPQKQNPDFLELVRAGAARIHGNLAAFLALLKGLPSGYQRDLQLDKEILFEAVDRIEGMLAVLTQGIAGLRWNPAALAKQLSDESIYATDLAEYLVRQGVPFARAHRAVGQLLAHADRQGTALASLPLKTFRRFSPGFDSGVHRLLDPAASVRRKQSFGSTHPGKVAQAIRRWKKRLKGPGPFRS